MRHLTTSSRTLDRLSGLPGVGQLPRKTRKSIDRLSYEVHIRQGETLIRQGQIGSQAFIIAAGLVEIRDRGRVITTKAAGELIGEAAVLRGVVRNADAVAKSDLTLLVMSTAELLTLFDDRAFRAWVSGTHSVQASTRRPSLSVAGVGFEPT